MKGRHKVRMEIETPVNYEAMKRILELIGFRIKETYSKIREEYRLIGCAVCLDHLPGAGWFIEIEGPPAKIRYIAKRLGLQSVDREDRSYRKLIREAAGINPLSANGSGELVLA